MIDYPVNHSVVCGMVAPKCLCNTCRHDHDGIKEDACCKKHEHAKCLIESCPDYEKETPKKKAEDGYDF